MIIDTLYESVIAQLTKQGKIVSISNDLLLFQRNEERVLYVYNLIESLKVFPSILEVNKSETVSIHYRNLGNKCFKKYDNYRAWQFYNLSLLHAPLDSESYVLALANRSAVFFELDKFIECLDDIQKVLSMTYPEKLKEKLNKRKAGCELQLSLKKVSLVEEQKSCSVDLTLKESQGARYPCASTKLKVVFDKKMGRHIVATSDIKVGEVLVQEEPYFKLLLKSQILFACNYCLSRNLNLLPCPNCCFALYCSVDCKEKAQKEYHDVECPLMATIIDMEFTKLEHLALRTVIKARNDCSDWKALLQYIKDVESNEDSEYKGHVKVNDEWVYDSKYYASIHTLESNIDKRAISDIFQKSVTAAVFLWLLMKKTDFLAIEEEQLKENVRKCVSGLLLLHLMTSPTNMHGISSNISSANGNYVEELSIACAAYAYHSLINHSCAPNVVRFSKLGTGQMSLIALRPIKKGMQLFDNYGAHHAVSDLMSRQEHLRFQYKFTCFCEACVHNWPRYVEMTRAGRTKSVPRNLAVFKENILSASTIQKLQEGDKTTAESMFKLLCGLAEKLEPYAPCTELADCQEALKQCLAILEGLVPYGYSQMVNWSAKPPTL